MDAMRSAADPTELAVLLIPLQGRQLVLPNVNVAEVMPWQSPRVEAEAGPDWLLGSLEWRQQQLPLVSLERMNGETVAFAGASQRIAVLNDVLGADELPFFAVVTTGAPRLLRLFPDEIGPDLERQPGPMEQSRVWVAGERGSIFDLARVEATLRQALA